jgi:hypothetical protein
MKNFKNRMEKKFERRNASPVRKNFFSPVFFEYEEI